ncbi:hypothetical protein [Streptomyces candidus]|uniref:Uncharacterized protein n=1 Tax=Streptomyces candidus TaxID=67283 RepID=A0A7X0HL05_9ACTN|nr:hypothetical protein [Streptomyces candidus]MBB6439614.1 hypothetical protein [Streptomyces candidus]GHH56393.1 hypothetical protein GCM10018773_62330 [Streptomyces candidus]
MPLPDSLKAGDVLLTRGTGCISRAICLLDGSEVSHALLVLDRDTIAEAVGQGLRTASFEQAQDKHDLVVGRTLTTAPADMAPVLDVARGYLTRGASYAHQQILLLAVLCVTRRAPMPPGGRRMVRTVLDQAAAAVNAMAERGQQPMVCSEFVYRCHREARPPPSPYALSIGDNGQPDGQTLLQWAHTHPALPGVPLRLAGVFDPASAESALAPLLRAYATAVDTSGTLPAGLRPPSPSALNDPSDEELLSSMVTFGNASHRARTRQMHEGGLPPEQTLDQIRAMEAQPDFVTPGDLLRTLSLTERFRQATAGTVPGKLTGIPLPGARARKAVFQAPGTDTEQQETRGQDT